MAAINGRTDLCGTCGASLTVGGFVQAVGRRLHAFCSEDCLGGWRRERFKARWLARGRMARKVSILAVLVGVLIAPHPQAAHLTAIERAPPAQPTPLPEGWFGPDWPPTDTSLLAALGRDAWLHPLAGPVRRMPLRDSRVFGAVRPGNRPSDCRNGHCGVDLGGEIWGEHIRAVHDGVVDYVQRGANPQRGGRFVRISHRNGTVFTQYFHLAAIPRGLERGVRVKAGDVVGLLGDSGVHESAPHLHFAISIRAHPGGPEKYMDPEPLITLWPLKVPVDGGETGLVTTTARVGVPLGSMPLLRGRGKKAAAQKSGRPAAADESGESEGGEETAPAATPAESAAEGD